MAISLLKKKGMFQFEEALEVMKWDTAKFEKELEIYAKTQSPKMQERLRKEYNRFMSGCGWPLELVVVGECEGVKVNIPKVKKKPETAVALPTQPKSEVETVTTQTETMKTETEQKTEIQPETIPLPQPVSEPEKKPETPKEPQPAKTKIETDTQASAYFTYPDANLFKKLYDSMSILVCETTWKIDKDSLSMRQMDHSRVALIDLVIGKENFEEWTVKTPGYVSFNAEEIQKNVFAKPFKKDTTIGVKIDGETQKITFIIKDTRTRELEFPTLEAEIEEVPTPKIVFNAKCKVVSKQVAADIKDLEKLSDHMAIIATLDSLTLQVNGDCGKGKTTYKRDDEIVLDLEVKEESRAVFSFSYLKDFINPALSEMALLEFSTDMPLKVTLLTKFGDLKFFMAPRLESE